MAGRWRCARFPGEIAAWHTEHDRAAVTVKLVDIIMPTGNDWFITWHGYCGVEWDQRHQVCSA